MPNNQDYTFRINFDTSNPESVKEVASYLGDAAQRAKEVVEQAKQIAATSKTFEAALSAAAKAAGISVAQLKAQLLEDADAAAKLQKGAAELAAEWEKSTEREIAAARKASAARIKETERAVAAEKKAIAELEQANRASFESFLGGAGGGLGGGGGAGGSGGEGGGGFGVFGSLLAGRIGGRIAGAELGSLAGIPGGGFIGSQLAYGLGISGGAAGGVLAGAGLLFGGIELAKHTEELLKYAQAQRNLAQELGVSSGAMATFTAVAESSGVKIETAAKGVSKLGEELAKGGARSREITEAFSRLGLGNNVAFQEPLKAIQAITEALSKISDPAERMRVAIQLGGDSFRVLAQEADRLPDLTAKLQVSDHVIDNLARVKDAIGLIGQEIKNFSLESLSKAVDFLKGDLSSLVSQRPHDERELTPDKIAQRLKDLGKDATPSWYAQAAKAEEEARKVVSQDEPIRPGILGIGPTLPPRQAPTHDDRLTPEIERVLQSREEVEASHRESPEDRLRRMESDFRWRLLANPPKPTQAVTPQLSVGDFGQISDTFRQFDQKTEGIRQPAPFSITGNVDREGVKEPDKYQSDVLDSIFNYRTQHGTNEERHRAILDAIERQERRDYDSRQILPGKKGHISEEEWQRRFDASAKARQEEAERYEKERQQEQQLLQIKNFAPVADLSFRDVFSEVEQASRRQGVFPALREEAPGTEGRTLYEQRYGGGGRLSEYLQQRPVVTPFGEFTVPVPEAGKPLEIHPTTSGTSFSFPGSDPGQLLSAYSDKLVAQIVGVFTPELREKRQEQAARTDAAAIERDLKDREEDLRRRLAEVDTREHQALFRARGEDTLATSTARRETVQESGFRRFGLTQEEVRTRELSNTLEDIQRQSQIRQNYLQTQADIEKNAAAAKIREADRDQAVGNTEAAFRARQDAAKLEEEAVQKLLDKKAAETDATAKSVEALIRFNESIEKSAKKVQDEISGGLTSIALGAQEGQLRGGRGGQGALDALRGFFTHIEGQFLNNIFGHLLQSGGITGPNGSIGQVGRRLGLPDWLTEGTIFQHQEPYAKLDDSAFALKGAADAHLEAAHAHMELVERQSRLAQEEYHREIFGKQVVPDSSPTHTPSSTTAPQPQVVVVQVPGPNAPAQGGNGYTPAIIPAFPGSTLMAPFGFQGLNSAQTVNAVGVPTVAVPAKLDATAIPLPGLGTVGLPLPSGLAVYGPGSIRQAPGLPTSAPAPQIAQAVQNAPGVPIGSQLVNIRSAVQQASREFDVPEPILQQLVVHESSNNPKALGPVLPSGERAMGLTQLLPGTASEMGVKNPFDIQDNVRGGARYLRQMYDKTGNWQDALIAYNEGPGRFDEGVRNPKSVAYAASILQDAKSQGSTIELLPKTEDQYTRAVEGPYGQASVSSGVAPGALAPISITGEAVSPIIRVHAPGEVVQQAASLPQAAPEPRYAPNQPAPIDIHFPLLGGEIAPRGGGRSPITATRALPFSGTSAGTPGALLGPPTVVPSPRPFHAPDFNASAFVGPTPTVEPPAFHLARPAIASPAVLANLQHPAAAPHVTPSDAQLQGPAAQKPTLPQQMLEPVTNFLGTPQVIAYTRRTRTPVTAYSDSRDPAYGQFSPSSKHIDLNAANLGEEDLHETITHESTHALLLPMLDTLAKDKELERYTPAIRKALVESRGALYTGPGGTELPERNVMTEALAYATSPGDKTTIPGLTVEQSHIYVQRAMQDIANAGHPEIVSTYNKLTDNRYAPAQATGGRVVVAPPTQPAPGLQVMRQTPLLPTKAAPVPPTSITVHSPQDVVSQGPLDLRPAPTAPLVGQYGPETDAALEKAASLGTQVGIPLGLGFLGGPMELGARTLGPMLTQAILGPFDQPRTDGVMASAVGDEKSVFETGASRLVEANVPRVEVGFHNGGKTPEVFRSAEQIAADLSRVKIEPGETLQDALGRTSQLHEEYRRTSRLDAVMLARKQRPELANVIEATDNPDEWGKVAHGQLDDFQKLLEQRSRMVNEASQAAHNRLMDQILERNRARFFQAPSSQSQQPPAPALPLAPQLPLPELPDLQQLPLPGSVTGQQFITRNPAAGVYEEGERLSKFSPDTPIYVFHATDQPTYEQFLKEGIQPGQKPMRLARMNYEQGDYAEYGPGNGLSGDTYVGGSVNEVSGYGRYVAGIRTKIGALQVSPEQAGLGVTSGAHALASGDATISHPVAPEDIVPFGRVTTRMDSVDVQKVLEQHAATRDIPQYFTPDRKIQALNSDEPQEPSQYPVPVTTVTGLPVPTTLPELPEQPERDHGRTLDITTEFSPSGKMFANVGGTLIHQRAPYEPIPLGGDDNSGPTWEDLQWFTSHNNQPEPQAVPRPASPRTRASQVTDVVGQTGAIGRFLEGLLHPARAFQSGSVQQLPANAVPEIQGLNLSQPAEGGAVGYDLAPQYFAPETTYPIAPLAPAIPQFSQPFSAPAEDQYSAIQQVVGGGLSFAPSVDIQHPSIATPTDLSDLQPITYQPPTIEAPDVLSQYPQPANAPGTDSMRRRMNLDDTISYVSAPTPSYDTTQVPAPTLPSPTTSQAGGGTTPTPAMSAVAQDVAQIGGLASAISPIATIAGAAGSGTPMSGQQAAKMAAQSTGRLGRFFGGLQYTGTPQDIFTGVHKTPIPDVSDGTGGMMQGPPQIYTSLPITDPTGMIGGFQLPIGAGVADFDSSSTNIFTESGQLPQLPTTSVTGESDDAVMANAGLFSGDSISAPLSAAEKVGAIAGTAGAAFGAYQGISTIAKGGAKNVSGGLAETLGAIAPFTGPAAPFVAAAAAVAGLVSAFLPDNRLLRKQEEDKRMLEQQYLAPPSQHLSISGNGGYADVDASGNVRTSNFSPYPVVAAPYIDVPRKTVIPGNIISSFGGTGTPQAGAMQPSGSYLLPIPGTPGNTGAPAGVLTPPMLPVPFNFTGINSGLPVTTSSTTNNPGSGSDDHNPDFSIGPAMASRVLGMPASRFGESGSSTHGLVGRLLAAGSNGGPTNVLGIPIGQFGGTTSHSGLLGSLLGGLAGGASLSNLPPALLSELTHHGSPASATSPAMLASSRSSEFTALAQMASPFSSLEAAQADARRSQDPAPASQIAQRAATTSDSPENMQLRANDPKTGIRQSYGTRAGADATYGSSRGDVHLHMNINTMDAKSFQDNAGKILDSVHIALQSGYHPVIGTLRGQIGLE